MPGMISKFKLFILLLLFCVIGASLALHRSHDESVYIVLLTSQRSLVDVMLGSNERVVLSVADLNHNIQRSLHVFTEEFRPDIARYLPAQQLVCVFGNNTDSNRVEIQFIDLSGNVIWKSAICDYADASHFGVPFCRGKSVFLQCGDRLLEISVGNRKISAHPILRQLPPDVANLMRNYERNLLPVDEQKSKYLLCYAPIKIQMIGRRKIMSAPKGGRLFIFDSQTRTLISTGLAGRDISPAHNDFFALGGPIGGETTDIKIIDGSLRQIGHFNISGNQSGMRWSPSDSSIGVLSGGEMKIYSSRSGKNLAVFHGVRDPIDWDFIRDPVPTE